MACALKGLFWTPCCQRRSATKSTKVAAMMAMMHVQYSTGTIITLP